MSTRQTVTHLPVAALTAHPANVRSDLGVLEDLALSIREHGILQPLTVTEHTDDGYLVLAGHRRLSAALLAGLTRVPVIIRHGVTDAGDQLVLMLVENCQRADLHPLDRADAYGALRNQGLSHADIARRTGVSVATVSRFLTLLDLPEEEREQLRESGTSANSILTRIRAEREEKRKDKGAGRVGRPKGRKTTPYFSDQHRLSVQVRKRCDHRGTPKVGGVGCGPCWENTIRQDALTSGGGPVMAPPPPDVDEIVVERILGGDWKYPATTAERAAVVDRWRAAGKSLNYLGRLTGWKPQRYYTPDRQEAS